MRRFFMMSAVVTAVLSVVLFTGCGGGKSSKASRQALVTLDELDDYYTVKSYTIESNAEELGVEKLDLVKGTLTVVIKREDKEMKYKPSDVEYARVTGEVANSDYYVFKGDCDAVAKRILKMEPKAEETFSIGFKGIDPYNQFNSDEENAANRQNAYDALTKKGFIDQISFDIEFKQEELEEAKRLKELFSDDDDDDDDDD